MQPVTFTAYTNDDSQVEAIKAFMKVLKIKFDFPKEKPYDLAFVEGILESREQAKKRGSDESEERGFESFSRFVEWCTI